MIKELNTLHFLGKEMVFADDRRLRKQEETSKKAAQNLFSAENFTGAQLLI